MFGDVGIPHYTMEASLSHLVADNQYTYLLPQDDWYEGFFIPKGTICLANIWCVFKFVLLCLKRPDYLFRSMNRDSTIYVGRSMMSAGNSLILTLGSRCGRFQSGPFHRPRRTGYSAHSRHKRRYGCCLTA